MFSLRKVMIGFIIPVIAMTIIGLSVNVVISEEKGTAMTAAEPAGVSSNPQGASMRVLWKVTEYKAGPASTLKKEDADKLVFSPLDIDASRITFAGKNCTNVVFQRERVPLGEYLTRVHAASLQAIGLSDQEVEVVKTNCTLPGFSEYFRLPDRRLVIVIDGTFFFLEPAVTY